MSRRKKAVKGLESELIVQLKLVKDPNLIVFTPIGGLGLVKYRVRAMTPISDRPL